jgi:hypothetical protein
MTHSSCSLLSCYLSDENADADDRTEHGLALFTVSETNVGCAILTAGLAAMSPNFLPSFILLNDAYKKVRREEDELRR